MPVTMFVRALLCLAAVVLPAAADSRQRNPLQYLAKIEQPEIQTSSGRVNAFSRFDLTFSLDHFTRRLRLSLEPNDDVIPAGAHVNYLDDDGNVAHSEPIKRLEHKVYRGSASTQRDDGSWAKVGWARITVNRDGPQPLFEGAFSVNHDSHHVEMASTYRETRHHLDPDVELGDGADDFMILYRDSDISPSPSGPLADHTELKRDLSDFQCLAGQLNFNSRLDHPIFRRTIKRSEKHWGAVPFSQLFGKRQIDNQPGAGNRGSVDLSSTIGQSAGCPTTKKVALVGVAADCGYRASFPSDAALRRRAIQLMSSASHVWESTFNISLGLANLTISKPNCPGSRQSATPWNRDCNNGLNITDRLNLFSKWRGDQTDSNSHWTLLTKCRTGSAVGLAWLGQACVQNSVTSAVAGGGSETVSGANVVALTGTEWQVIAHETGHTFGAVHDCDDTTCPDTAYVSSGQCCPFSRGECSAQQQFIMNPFTATGINQFSPCTLGNICSAMGGGSINTDCLSANDGVTTITGRQCGNGIVEDGEECDCGNEQDCAGNTCCDPQTCKFTSGSVCDEANQDCCNNCQFAPKNSVCRPSSGECDPAEKCPGDKAVCPRDITAPNGQSCSIPDAPKGAGDLACASGQCTSRNYQCQTVIGAFTHKKSNDTYACDDTTCTLSCGSPIFGANTCYSLQQNMLDGTPCGGGGHCQNGQCDGSSFGGEVSNWINDHKGVVIGVAVAVGVLLLIFAISCICGCLRKRKRAIRRANDKNAGPPPAAGWYAGPPPPVPPHGVPYWQGNQAGNPPMVQQSPRGPANDVHPWSHGAQQGWRPPQSPSPGPAPLYGGGILGSRNPAAPGSPSYPHPGSPGYFNNFGSPSSARYA